MKTIKFNSINELIIKNSKFITLLYKIENENEIDSLLLKAKEDYPKATHYCYAYITKESQKSSDNGEPGGTAGTPMLNVLQKNDLINVLAITIRYFGGIKLGAGGLVRAYTKSVTKALETTDIITLEKACKIEISLEYEKKLELDQILKDSKIIKKDFNELITYQVIIKESTLNKLGQFSYKIIDKDQYIEN